jgi:predicted alpha/beta-hydrolase family hydrolase
MVRTSGSDVMPDDINVALENGAATSAMSYAAADPAGTLLVLAHGAGAGQRHPFMVSMANALASRGIDVMTFNFPYMEQRRRVPDRAPVLESCFRSVVAAALDRDSFRSRTLFIGGKSMGGRMATHLAAQGMERLAGVIALGYPLHPPGKPEQVRSAHLPEIAVPVLIVQGERDAFGTPAELAPVIETMTAQVTVHVVPGGDHSLAVRGQKTPETLETVSTIVANWMTEVTRGQTPLQPDSTP